MFCNINKTQEVRDVTARTVTQLGQPAAKYL